MPRLFDAYIMVDWSAAAKPVTGPNSIWIGLLAKDARLKFQFQAVNPDTRLKARDFLKDIIEKLTRRGDRVLLGFDFSLGYPSGTAAALHIADNEPQPWQAIHKHFASKLKDKADNSNARFAIAAGMNYAISKKAFPFWGAPSKDQVTTMSSKRPAYEENCSLAEYRTTEIYLRETYSVQPKSCWQLAYAGSVGSQSLLGIPHVHFLRSSFSNALLWPFETGLIELDEAALETTQLVIAEIYPSLLNVKATKEAPLDRAQVEAIAHHYCDLDRQSRLGSLFGPPKGLDMKKIPQIEQEEGWILGI